MGNIFLHKQTLGFDFPVGWEKWIPDEQKKVLLWGASESVSLPLLHYCYLYGLGPDQRSSLGKVPQGYLVQMLGPQLQLLHFARTHPSIDMAFLNFPLCLLLFPVPKAVPGLEGDSGLILLGYCSWRLMSVGEMWLGLETQRREEGTLHVLVAWLLTERNAGGYWVNSVLWWLYLQKAMAN